MVCPNCQADDNVAIQGQSFCLNCGFLIPEKPVTAQPAPAVPKLPTPAAVTITTGPTAHERTLTSPAKLTPSEHPALKPLPKVPAPSPQSSPQPMVDSMSTPKSQPAAARPRPRATGSFGSPAGPALPTVLPVPALLPHASPSKPLMGTARSSSTSPHGRINTGHGPMMALSGAHSLAHHHSSSPVGRRFGLTATIVVAVPAALWFAIKLGSIRGQSLTWSRHSAGMLWSLLVASKTGLATHLGLIGLIAVVGYGVLGILTKVWALAALTHGYAKQLDERPVDPGDWSVAAWNSLPGLIGVDLLGAVLVIPVITAGIAIVYLAPTLGYGAVVQYAVQAVGGGAALLLAIAVGARTVYSSQAVVLGALSPLAAWKVGGRLYRARRRHTLGVAALSLAVVLGVGLLALAIIGTAAVTLGTIGDLATYLSLILFVSIVAIGVAYHYVLVYVVVLWLHAYREAVAAHLPDALVALTLGRNDSRAQLAPAIILGLSLMLLAGGAVVAVWLLGGPLLTGVGNGAGFWFVWR